MGRDVRGDGRGSAFTLILLGLGLDEFSMPSIMIPEIKHIIRSVNMSQAKQIAEEAVSLPTAAEVESFVNRKLKELEASK